MYVYVFLRVEGCDWMRTGGSSFSSVVISG